MRDTFVQLLNYGPFDDLPKKDGWALFGSGPTLGKGLEYLKSHDIGILTVNESLNAVPRSDVSIFGHYEDYVILRILGNMKKADRIYMPNPIEVGNRCVELSASNLYNLTAMDYLFPGKFRWYEKTRTLERAVTSPHYLFHGCTVSLAGLHLLARNNVKKLMVFGVDGGKDHDPKLDYFYSEYGIENMVFYDESKKIFESTAKELGVELIYDGF